MSACASLDFRASRYTGKERDTESGLDYFGARYYGSSTGRFMSPDPSGLAFADPTNPQSLNLYSYVRNNPLIYTDPTGLSCQGDPGEPQSDDGDGKGCAAAGINPDGSETTKTVQATVTASPMSDQEIGNLGFSLEMNSTTPIPKLPTPKGLPHFPLPANAMTCTTSAGVTFAAPPDFNPYLPYEKGEDEGFVGGVVNAGQYVGQGGRFDYQRQQIGGTEGNVRGYVPVADIAVGAYQYGAGESALVGSAISNGYASIFSANGSTAEQAQFRQLGRDLVSGKVTYSCQTHP